MDSARIVWLMGAHPSVRSVEVMLIFAIVLISAALALYTAGVWGERRSGTLLVRHVALFASGFACDAGGTALMTRIAESGTYSADGIAAVLTTLMSVTGGLALALMGIHLLWAVGVMSKGSSEARKVFHRFSVVVWAIWLVPYFTGMSSAMFR